MTIIEALKKANGRAIKRSIWHSSRLEDVGKARCYLHYIMDNPGMAYNPETITIVDAIADDWEVVPKKVTLWANVYKHIYRDHIDYNLGNFVTPNETEIRALGVGKDDYVKTISFEVEE